MGNGGVNLGVVGVDWSENGGGATICGLRVGGSSGRGFEIGANAAIGVEVNGHGLAAGSRADIGIGGSTGLSAGAAASATAGNQHVSASALAALKSFKSRTTRTYDITSEGDEFKKSIWRGGFDAQTKWLLVHGKPHDSEEDVVRKADLSKIEEFIDAKCREEEGTPLSTVLKNPTKSEFLDKINSLQKDHNYVCLWYIGHGYDGGVSLKDGCLSYNCFDSKFYKCVISACHSGSIGSCNKVKSRHDTRYDYYSCPSSESSYRRKVYTKDWGWFTGDAFSLWLMDQITNSKLEEINHDGKYGGKVISFE